MENRPKYYSNYISLANLIPLSPGVSVVELGCGPGRDIILAARQIGEQGRVLGTDMAPEMIDLAGQAVAEARLNKRNITLKIAEVGALPHPKNFADVLLVNCIDSRCPDRNMMLKNIFRIMRPGGHLLVSDIVTGSRETAELMTEQVYSTILQRMSFMEIQVLARYPLDNRPDMIGAFVTVFSALKPPLNC